MLFNQPSDLFPRRSYGMISTRCNERFSYRRISFTLKDRSVLRTGWSGQRDFLTVGLLQDGGPLSGPHPLQAQPLPL